MKSLRIAGRSRLLQKQNHVLMRRGVVGGGSVPRSVGCGYAALGTAKEYVDQIGGCMTPNVGQLPSAVRTDDGRRRLSHKRVEPDRAILSRLDLSFFLELFWAFKARTALVRIENRLPVQEQEEPASHGVGPHFRTDRREVLVTDGIVE